MFHVFCQPRFAGNWIQLLINGYAVGGQGPDGLPAKNPAAVANWLIDQANNPLAGKIDPANLGLLQTAMS